MSADFIHRHASGSGMLRRLGKTGNGFQVYDRPASHSHLEPRLLAEALRRVAVLPQPFAKYIVEFERPIASCDCVETGSTDQIVYARRPKRHGLSRFVIGRSPEPSRLISLILKWREDDPTGLILISAYPGAAEPEPWDRHATATSLAFWQSHALCWGSCEIDLMTLTLHCSWAANLGTAA